MLLQADYRDEGHAQCCYKLIIEMKDTTNLAD